MRIVIDSARIESRMKLARTLTLIGLLILGAGFLLSLVGTGWLMERGIDPLPVSCLFLLFGWGISQIALYFNYRYGGRYRPDHVIDNAVRGLDNRYVIFHHVKGLPPHVLLSPSGAWAIEAKHQSGLIRWSNGRWHHDMPLKILRSFFQESLGNPGREAGYALEELKKALAKPDVPELPARSAVVFIDANARVEAEGAPVPAMHVSQFKDFVRQVDRECEHPVSRATIDQAAQALGSGLPEAQAVSEPDTADSEAAPARREGRTGGARRRRRAKGKGKGT